MERGTASFVLVINSPLAPVRATLKLIERRRKAAIERLYPVEPERFKPIETVELPVGHAYLMLDIDRGQDTLNVAPDAALGSLAELGRSPLTIGEGIALLTHFRSSCSRTTASRCSPRVVATNVSLRCG